MNKKLKAIWLFAGGGMQREAAEKILDWGYKLILTDKNSKCVCAKYADEFINLDTFDIEKNLKAAQKLKNKYQIKAVVTLGADCHETVARIAKFLNLPGLDPKISRICRYKLEGRRILTDKGIFQPAFAKVKTFIEGQKILKKIGLPAIVKASDNSGSRGLSIVRKASDFTQEVFDRALVNGSTGYVILEQLLIPLKKEVAEQSVETLWYGGKMYWLNWVDRLFRKDLQFFKNFPANKLYSGMSWGVEIGHVNPAVHDLKTQKSVKDLVYRAGLAIGMDKQKNGHILKADIMLTDKGPVILELTPRLSGGWDSAKTTPLRGADFIGGVLALALGEEVSLDFLKKYFYYKKPALFASVFTLIKRGARDCIGREFAAGTDFDRSSSLSNAYNNLKVGKYLH